MTKAEKMFWGVFAAVVVVIFAAGLFWRVTHPVTSSSSNFVPTTTAAISAGDWTTGAKGGAVSLIEYGDFQCPACGAYEPIVEQLRAAYGTKVTFVFRNFPLSQHPDAHIAAQAAEAAGLQGKYWEMHDLLYQKQNEWTTAAPDAVVQQYFNGYAQTLGLDVTKFDTDVTSSAVIAKVQKDMNAGTAAGVDHTPTFFVNLTQIPNPNSVPDFKVLLDAAIASSTAQ